MRYVARLMAVVLLGVQAAGCASTGGGGEGGRTLGPEVTGLTRGGVLAHVPGILSRYGYRVLRRQEQPQSLYFETDWESRTPFPDEAEQGFQVAETRIIVRATYRMRRLDTRLYSVQFEGQNRFKRTPDSGWEEIAATEMFKTHLETISRALEPYVR